VAEGPRQQLRHGHRHRSTRRIEQARTPCSDIDYQGGRQIRQKWRDDSVLCFILPPSSRAGAAAAAAGHRQSRDHRAPSCHGAQGAFHYQEYDYLVVNDQLEKAYDELRSIYIAER
jgi:guanylate kinase